MTSHDLTPLPPNTNVRTAAPQQRVARVFVLVGPAASGKTFFSTVNFLPSEILSSDAFREMVCDDASDMSSTQPAFDLLYRAARERVRRGLVTVVDATNLGHVAHERIVELAEAGPVRFYPVVFDIPEQVCQLRNVGRARKVPPHVITRQCTYLHACVEQLPDIYEPAFTITPENEHRVRVQAYRPDDGPVIYESAHADAVPDSY